MKPTKEFFGQRVRPRVCGLCFRGEAILLVKHNLDGDVLWAPPGGEIAFGESSEEALIREFKEETRLDIKPGKFLFFTEYINPPLHALELFYKVDKYTGTPAPGNDPELTDRQIITDIGFFDSTALQTIPGEQLHHILKNCTNPIHLLDKQGQLK